MSDAEHRAGSQRWRVSIMAAPHGQGHPDAGRGRADSWAALRAPASAVHILWGPLPLSEGWTWGIRHSWSDAM